MPARSPLRRRIQLAGALLMLATAVMPVYSCRSRPKDFEGPVRVDLQEEARVRIPAEEIVRKLGERGFDALGSLKEWFPYVFALFWPFALVAAARGARRKAGAVMFGTSVAIATLAFAYLWFWYVPVLPKGLKALETGALMFAAGWVLFRRRGWRNREDVEGYVAAQAFVCLFHTLSWPGYEVIQWWGEHSASAIARTILTNYLWGFWLAVVGLVLVVAPRCWPTRRAASGGTTPAPG